MEDPIYYGYSSIANFRSYYNRDAARLIRCFWVFGVFCVLAGIVYFFARDIRVAGAICGAVAVLLSLYNTAFGLFVLFSFFSIENAIVISPYFTISKAMGFVVLASFLLRMFREKMIISKSLKIVFVFAIWCFLSLLWSMLPAYTFLNWVSIVLNIGLVVIVLNTVKDKQSLYLVISGFAFGAAIASFLVVAGHVAQKSQSIPGLERAALHEETNTVVLALSLGVGFLAAFYVFFQEGKYKKILAIGLMPLIFVAMVKTQSRMPTLAALSIPIIAMVMCSKREKRLKYIIFASMSAILFAIVVYVVIHSDMMSEAARKRLVQDGFEESGRLSFWIMGFKAFLYRPFHGYGLNNFHLIPNNLQGRAAHNDVVAITVDLGLIGLAMIVSVFVILYKQISRYSDIALKWLAISFILYPWVTGITVTNYTKKEFWYSLAIAITAVNISKLQHEQNQIYGDMPDVEIDY